MGGTYREIAGTTIEDQTKKTHRTDSSGDIIHNGKRVLQKGTKNGVQHSDAEKLPPDEVYKEDKSLKIRLFCTDPNHKNVEIKEDEITYISAVPEMPKIVAKVESVINGPMKPILRLEPYLPAVLEIEYKVNSGKKQRNDLQRYPITENYHIKLYREWDFMNVSSFNPQSPSVFSHEILPFYKDVFRGGKATLKVYENATLSTVIKKFSFQIRGLNPTKQQVKDYITDKKYDISYWFFYKMLLQESGSANGDGMSYNHVQHFNSIDFNKKMKEGIDYNSQLGGTPNFYEPDGWGVCQIDFAAEKNSRSDMEKYHKKDMEYIDNLTKHPNYLWNWKDNIDVQFNYKLPEKLQISQNDLMSELNSIIKKNPNFKLKSFSIKEGNITYKTCPSEIPAVSKVNNKIGFSDFNKYMPDTAKDGTEKSIFDAHLIRRNNGGRYITNISSDGVLTIERVNNLGFNYNERVGGIQE